MNYVIENDGIYLKDNNNVLAQINFRKISDTEYDIYYVYVSDNLRGKGIAGILVNRAIEYIENKGCSYIASCSYAKNWLEKNK